MLWEDALRSVASSTQGDVTDRSSVAGSGSSTWITGYQVATSPGSANPSSYQSSYDFYAYASYSTSIGPYTTVLGATIDWTGMDDSSGPLYLFNHQPQNILTPLVWLPNQNDTTSVWSFDAAVQSLQDIDAWLTGWIPTVNGWASAIGDTGSDWEGSAAAAFKWTLLSFAGEMQNLHLQLNTPSNRWSGLQDAWAQLLATQSALYTGWQDWNQSSLAWPHNCLQQALTTAMTGQTPTVTTTNTYVSGYETSYDDVGISASFNVPNYGDPTTQAFWTAIEAAAKVLWLDNVQSTMDAQATPTMGKLGTAYQTAANQLGSLVAIELNQPPQSNTNTNLDSNLNSNLNLNTGGGANTPPTDGGGGLNTDTSSTNLPNATGNLAPGANTSTNTPAVMTNTGSGNLGGNLNTDVNSGSPVSEDTVLGPDGKPLTDPTTGEDLLVPSGSTIAADGEIIGPDGKPVLGANGKPITVPKGSKIGQSDGAAGNVVVPQGSKLNPNGTVTGPDGKEVLDANGNPLVLAKGSTIAADGTVLGPGGKTIPLDSQLLTDQEQALANQGTNLLGGGSPSSLAALQSSVPTVGGTQVTDSGGGLGQTALDRNAALLGTGTSSGTSQTATASSEGIDPTGAATTPTSAGTTASAAAEGEPMMPMSGMGAGANGQQNGQDRQRTTWLAEEEAVWGTDIDAVSGTIGR